MTAWCEFPSCHALIVMGPETKGTKRCYVHLRAKFDEEGDDERLERVCKTMGWRRAKPR